MATHQEQQLNKDQHDTQISKWFDDFVGMLRSHELQLETNTANNDLKSLYDNLISGSLEETITINKKMGIEYFVKRIITEYLQYLTKENIPNKLAFDYNDSEVLVWAEVPDNSEVLEQKLIMAEAAISAKYHESGYDMTSTIVESSDRLNIPNHYRILKMS